MTTRLARVATDPLSTFSMGRAGRRFLIGLVCFVVLWDLGGRSLHVFDTTRWGELAREMVRSGQWLVPQRYGELYVNKPPLYLWAVALPSSCFGGVTPFWVRLPSALGLLALVWTTARWTQMRLGSQRLARTASLITLTSLGVIWLGREGRLDMMSSALAVSAAYLWDKAALGHGTRATPWLAGLVLGLALLTKGPPLLIVPLAILCTPGADQTLRDRLRLGRPWLVLPVAIVVALCWFVPAVMQAGWDAYGRKLLVDQAADRLAGTSTHTHGPLYYFGAIPLALAPWGIAYLATAVLVWVPRFRRMLGATAPLAMAGALALSVFILVPTKHARYLIPLVPLFAMPVARGAWLWVHRTDGFDATKWFRIFSTLLGLAGLAACILAVWSRYEPSAPAAIAAMALSVYAGLLWLSEKTPNDADGRRKVLGAVLLGSALLLTTILALRTRWFTTHKEAFSNAVAAQITPDTRVVTLDGNSPGVIFHATDRARKYASAAQVPWGEHQDTWIVICHKEGIARLESASGRRAKLIAAREDANCVAVVLRAHDGNAAD